MVYTRSLQESAANFCYLVKQDSSTRCDLISITMIVVSLLALCVTAGVNGNLYLQWPMPEFFFFSALVISTVILIVHRAQAIRYKMQFVPEERNKNQELPSINIIPTSDSPFTNEQDGKGFIYVNQTTGRRRARSLRKTTNDITT